MRARHGKTNKRLLIIAIACLCIVACVAGGVFAYLTARTDTISNVFVPVKVTCEVEETFANGVKQNVMVKNTGDVNAYIRAVVVATFVSDDGKVSATAPIEGVDYTITWADTGWVRGTDGFWYHKAAVAPDARTATLIKTASAVTAPSGYRLNVQIVATAVQSDPQTAVQEAWGVTVSGGEIVPQ